jgi:transcriptional regulator with XRE-family HTH domain
MADIDSHIGGRVRDRRAELGVSQSHLASRLGITPQQMSKLERGVNAMRPILLYRAARALRVNVGWFFQGLRGNL